MVFIPKPKTNVIHDISSNLSIWFLIKLKFVLKHFLTGQLSSIYVPSNCFKKLSVKMVWNNTKAEINYFINLTVVEFVCYTEILIENLVFFILNLHVIHCRRRTKINGNVTKVENTQNLPFSRARVTLEKYCIKL